MTTSHLYHRPPAPLDLLDQTAEQAEANHLRATETEDANDLCRAEAHRAALDQLTVQLLGRTPSAASNTFDGVAVPSLTSERHWHLGLTNGTVRWLDNLAIDDTDPDALVDGLLAMIINDQRDFALRLHHMDEAAEHLGVTSDAVRDFIGCGRVGHCFLADTAWVVPS
jgi:hypothetical protein